MTNKDIKVGSTVKIITYDRTFLGKVPFIFKANVTPSKADIKKYYNLEPGDKYYKLVSLSKDFDRVVIEHKEGHYVVFPNTQKFEGKISVHNQKLYESPLQERAAGRRTGMMTKNKDIEVGSRVKIREDLDPKAHYQAVTVTEDMAKRKGTEVMILHRIRVADNIFYKISGDPDFVWTSELFEKEIVLKPGQGVKIRPDLVPGTNYGGLVFHGSPYSLSNPDISVIDSILLDAITGIVLYRLKDSPASLWTQDMLITEAEARGDRELVFKDVYILPLLGKTNVTVWYHTESYDPKLFISAVAEKMNLTSIKHLNGKPDTDTVNAAIAKLLSRLYENYIRKQILNERER